MLKAILLMVLNIQIISGTFDRYSLLCCNSKWVLDASLEKECCNGKIYDKNKLVCCKGKLLPLPEGSDQHMAECCDGQPYNFKKQICCDGKLFTIPGLTKNYKCCTNQMYNKKEQICCAGKLHPKGNFTDCCGPAPYSEDLWKCCNNSLAPVPEPPVHWTYDCCGSKPYKVGLEICCNNIVSKKKAPWSMCCGDKGETYDLENEQCCDGELHEGKKWEDGYGCCGKKLFNDNTHKCCHDTGLILPVPNNTAHYDVYFGCCGGNKLYSFQNEVCCDGNIFKKLAFIGFDTECCGKHLWDVNTHACCDYETLIRYDDLHKYNCDQDCKAKNTFII